MNTLNRKSLFAIAATCLLTQANADVVLPKEAQHYLETAHVLEDKSLPSRNGELAVLVDYLKYNWREVFDNLQTVAPTDKEKRTIVNACESLDDKEYIAFLQKIEALFAQRQIDINVVEMALDPSETRSGFLADNWQNPAVRSLMMQFRDLIPAGHYLKDYPDKVLSGKAKAEKDDWDRDRMSNEKSPPASAATPWSSPAN